MQGFEALVIRRCRRWKVPQCKDSKFPDPNPKLHDRKSRMEKCPRKSFSSKIHPDSPDKNKKKKRKKPPKNPTDTEKRWGSQKIEIEQEAGRNEIPREREKRGEGQDDAEGAIGREKETPRNDRRTGIVSAFLRLVDEVWREIDARTWSQGESARVLVNRNEYPLDASRTKMRRVSGPLVPFFFLFFSPFHYPFLSSSAMPLARRRTTERRSRGRRGRRRRKGRPLLLV